MRFTLLPHTCHEALPLIYMWEIHASNGTLVGRYVGKAKSGASRPRTHYKKNVANILLNKPYRKGNPAGYRKVHCALAQAERESLQVTLHFLCNIEPHENINEVEQSYIRLHSCIGSEKWQLNA